MGVVGGGVPNNGYWFPGGRASQFLLSPGMTEMVRKITLSRALRIMQNLFPEEYNFYPRSWILPEEFQLFVAQVDGTLACDPRMIIIFGTAAVLGPNRSQVLGARLTGAPGSRAICLYTVWQPSRPLVKLNRQGDRGGGGGLIGEVGC